ncbi:MAG: tRNA (adenosine(37)-N6)-dimethylallyltransferase MiaA [Candidatus Liptonbacteria bacterium]|nr:tRNA (adenosine(37)-N6)-dimethylallyltransferase MiaA [Candidatus Liptonbacteria bacterium]
MQKQKMIVVLGPTATGKSKLAVKLAKKISARGGPAFGWNGAEIISADSRQIYRGLNIGTGKITKKEMGGVPHYLLSVVSLKKQFTAVDYQKRAARAVTNIVRRGKIPIICGGTGLYIDSLIYNYKLPHVEINRKLRGVLEKKSTAELFRKLRKLDPKRAKNIDRNNPRRLVRALEIVLETKQKIQNMPQKISQFNVLKIGIKKNQAELKKRIEKRVNTWIKEGLEEETRKISKQISQKRIKELGFNYSLSYFYLKNRTSKPELIQKLRQENWRYARRQMTWFKRDKEIKWIKSENEAEQLIAEFLNQKPRQGRRGN